MPQPAYKTKLPEEFHRCMDNLLLLLKKLGIGSGGRYSVDSSMYEKFLKAGCPDWSVLYTPKIDITNLTEALFEQKLLKTNTDPKQLKDAEGVHRIAREVLEMVPDLNPDGTRERLGVDIGINDKLKMFPLILFQLSPALFGTTGNDLLEKARSGHRKSILKLIQLDKNFIHEEWSAIELRKAQLSGDEKYLKDLAKAITGDALNPKKKNPRLTYILMMGWNLGLNKLANSEIFEYVKDIGLYGSEDPDSLYREIKRLKLRKRKKDA
jgi:hypothetical protein